MSHKYAPHDVIREDRADGSIILRARAPLGAVVARTTDWLDQWAARTPEAVFVAERDGAGWRKVTYAEAQAQARAIAGGLMDLDLGPARPILIVSGNSVDHALLALAAQYIGVPIVPLAEQYALIPAARGQIDHAAQTVTPGAVFAEDGDALAEVLARPVFDGVAKLVSRGCPDGALSLATLAQTGGDITAAHATVGPATVAKYLMTSGSTSTPKAVVTTQAMMCTNQTQIAQGLPFLTARPPVLLDWLPWNHVFGGSHNFNMVLANGGTLYVDGGKPTPAVDRQDAGKHGDGQRHHHVQRSRGLCHDPRCAARRRRPQAPLLRGAGHAVLRGASLPQDVWTDLEDMAREVRGDVPLFTSSWA